MARTVDRLKLMLMSSLSFMRSRGLERAVLYQKRAGNNNTEITHLAHTLHINAGADLRLS